MEFTLHFLVANCKICEHFSLENNRLTIWYTCMLAIFCAGYPEDDSTGTGVIYDTNINFTSVAATDRNFNCAEEGVYVCGGAGDIITLWASPGVPFNQPLRFNRAVDYFEFKTLRRGHLVGTLLTKVFPLMVVKVVTVRPSILYCRISDARGYAVHQKRIRFRPAGM